MVFKPLMRGEQKMLFETFYPDAWMNSTYQIDFDELYKKGYGG